MFLSILGIIQAVLSIWESKEKDKYNSQVLELKRVWLEEFNKPRGERDNGVMDNAEIELRMVMDALTNQILLQRK